MEEVEDFKCIECGKIVLAPEYMVSYCPFCGKQQILTSQKEEEVILDDDIEKMVYAWLSKTLNIDNWLISETVKNQMATVYLLIWPILETKIFNNDMSHNQINIVSNSVRDVMPDVELDDIAKHFYDRYQDLSKYRKLVVGRNWTKIERILGKSFNRIYKDEKIAFLIFVVYRYRNNIFHGIKSIKEWNKFSTEIQLCIKFMIMLGNCIDLKERT